MPRLDGMGPQGLGPRTGRGLGKCPKTSDQARYGMGRGYGFCRNCPFFVGSGISKEERLEILKEEKDLIEKEIKDLES